MLLNKSSIFLVSILTIIASLNANAKTSNPALTWHGLILGEDISNLHGGLKTGSILNSNAKIVANYDLKPKFGYNSLIKFGILGATYTRYQALYTDSIQTPTTYLSPRDIRISDLSYQYNFGDSNKIIIGIMDLDDNFNITEAASNLLNNAFSNTEALNSNTLLATFPFPGLGAMVSITRDQTTAMLGLYQGDPQHLSTVFYKGYMLIAEVDHIFNVASSSTTNYSIKGGAWLYQQSDPDVADGTNARGLYLITQANWMMGSARNLSAFFGFDYSDEIPKYVPYSLEAGVRSDNIFFGNKDSLSLGLAKVWVADLPSEVVYEIAYALQLYTGLLLTPDVQYIVKPSGILPNAWVAMLRLNYTF